MQRIILGYVSLTGSPFAAERGQGLIEHLDFLLYEKKIAKKMRRKNQKQRKRHDDQVRLLSSFTSSDPQLALVKVVVKVFRRAQNEKGQVQGIVEEEKELELFSADKFWLQFMRCYSKLLEGLAPISVCLWLLL